MTTHFRVRLNFKPPVAQVTLAAERVDRCRVIVPHFFLLRIVTDTHANMIVACSAELGNVIKDCCAKPLVKFLRTTKC